MNRREEAIRRSAAGIAILASVGLLVGACSKAQLGFPRIPVSVESPDHRFVAFVRNHPSVDPPSQSLWIRDPLMGEKMLRTLFPDVEWCEQIVWSSDSQHVAFLIEEAEVEVYDTIAKRLQRPIWLVPRREEYPPAAVVRNVSLSAGGRELTFRTCPRRDDPTKPLSRDLWDETTGPCSTVQRVEVGGVGMASDAPR
jgi:hypothetical protein